MGRLWFGVGGHSPTFCVWIWSGDSWFTESSACPEVESCMHVRRETVLGQEIMCSFGSPQLSEGLLNYQKDVSFLPKYPYHPNTQNSRTGTAFHDPPKTAGSPEPSWPLCPSHLEHLLADADEALLQGWDLVSRAAAVGAWCTLGFERCSLSMGWADQWELWWGRAGGLDPLPSFPPCPTPKHRFCAVFLDKSRVLGQCKCGATCWVFKVRGEAEAWRLHQAPQESLPSLPSILSPLCLHLPKRVFPVFSRWSRLRQKPKVKGADAHTLCVMELSYRMEF